MQKESIQRPGLAETMLSVAVRRKAVELVAQRICAARGSKKQKEIARLLDVEPGTISRWENGRTLPDIYMLERLAEATGKPLAYFFSGNEGTSQQHAVDHDEIENLRQALEQLLRQGLADLQQSMASVLQQQTALLREMRKVLKDQTELLERMSGSLPEQASPLPQGKRAQHRG